jgi:HEAT repeat protein
MIRKLSVLLGLLVAIGPSRLVMGQEAGEILIGGKPRSFWIEGLKSTDARMRLRSCDALGIMGQEAAVAVPVLLVAASDHDEKVRFAATSALGHIGQEARSAVPLILKQMLETSSMRELAVAQNALAGIGRPAVAELIKHLDDESIGRRFRSARVLEWIGRDAESAAPALVAQFQITHDGSVYSVDLVRALGSLGPKAKSVAPTLTRSLTESFAGGDNLATLRKSLTRALTRIGEPPVFFLLEKLSGRDSNDRLLAAELLGAIGPHAIESIEALETILKNRGADPDLRREVAIALSRIDARCPLVVPVLIEALEQFPESAFEAMTDLGPRAIAAAPSIVRILEGNMDDQRRRTAMRALVEIDPEGLQVLPALIDAFQHGPQDSIADAAEMLGQIGPPARECVPSMVKDFLARSSDDRARENPRILINTALALENIRSHPHFVVPAMISVLKDQNKSRIHREAMIALSGCGPAAGPAIPQMIAALDGPNQDMVAHVLGRIGPDAREALPALRASLRRRKPIESQSGLLMAIFRIDPSSASNIDGVLESIENFRDRAIISGFAGRACAEGEGLARIDLQALERSLARDDEESPPETVDPVDSRIGVLGGYGPSARAAIPRLTSLLNHKKHSVRSASREALGQIEGTTRP